VKTAVFRLFFSLCIIPVSLRIEMFFLNLHIARYWYTVYNSA